MRDLVLKLSQLLGTGLILGFFSEFFFLNEGPVFGFLSAWEDGPLTALVGLLELGGFYALFAAGFVIALDRFRVMGLAGLLLAGGIYGFAAEGLVVPVIYESVPFSLVWTSLSWHTLIDVVLGWYLMRRWLRAESPLPAALAFAGAGLFWGAWATWFWVDDPGAALSLGDFATMALASSLALLVGNVLADMAPVTKLHFSWGEISLVAVASAALFIVTGLPFLPLPVLALVLIGLILWALEVARRQDGPGAQTKLSALDPRPAPLRYLALALLPASAIASYALVLQTGFRVPTEDIVLIILFAGLASFLWAMIWPIWRTWRGRA